MNKSTSQNLTKCFCMLYIYITDDECFYVGMAHPAQSARKGNNYVPNDYRPFQCCPTKVERTTRVPKMSAQKLAHKKDTDEKSRFDFTPPSGSVAASAAPATAAAADAKKSLAKGKATDSASKLNAANKKSSDTKKSNDNHAAAVPSKEIKKSTGKAKDASKTKPGQKGLLGIAKIVDWF